jgi:hypothetical protein
MTQLTTPLYSASMEDKEVADCFLFDQQIGPKPKLRVYSNMDLQSVLSLAQYEYVKPMISNAQPNA